MSDALLDTLEAELGAGGVLTGEAAAEKAVSGWSRIGSPIAVVRPSSTEEVSAVLRLCNEARQPITPWGGKTGLVHGIFSNDMIALSLERMDQIEEVDPLGKTLTAEAGCILQTACEAAEEHDLLLPLDLGARGSAMLGGVISTNAGGNRVVKYGMMRDMVLGLEAVLADGTVISSMNHLIKNNTGYDLKQLFIGSEGTLGVVTRAVVRLRQMPHSQDTAWIGVDSFDALPRLLRHLDKGLAGNLSAFEVMWKEYVDLVTNAPALGRSPLQETWPLYVLVEQQGGEQEADSARFEEVLMQAMEQGMIADAAIAKSQAERNAMWELRDDVGQTSRNWPIYNYDVSLRIPHMEHYVEQVRAAVTAEWPEKGTLTVFGHMGDGNLHLIAGVPDRTPETKKRLNEIIYGPLRALGGSVSAEHGIGIEKRDYLSWSRSESEVGLMRLLKATLDPNGILNPGKVL
ncbi:MAG: FAD-binding oxidoreductase [Novosphingobium sp.]|nr:FAD-binding oxidoreductase [Novosphingobium sp.]